MSSTATSASTATASSSFTIKEFISGLGFGILIAFVGLISFTTLFPPPPNSPSLLTASTLLSLLFSPTFLLYFLLPTTLLLSAFFYLSPLLLFPSYSSSTLTIEQRALAQRRNLSALPSPYPNGWYRLMEGEELKEGDVKYVHAVGQDWAVYRTKGEEERNEETGEKVAGGSKRWGAGKVVVLDAYCPHLGANIAIGGKVVGNCIECPFHGWTFNPAGKCTSIPYAKKVPDVAKTVSWKVVEQNEGIYIWHDIDRKEPEWEVQPVLEGAAKGMKLHGKASVEISTHIQDLVSLHASHLDVDYTHPSNFYRVQLKTTSPWSFPSSSSSFTATRTGSLTVSSFGFPLLSSVPITITHLGISSLLYSLPSTPFGSFLLSQSFTPRSTNIQNMDTTIFSSNNNGVSRVIGKMILEGMKEEMMREERIWRERRWGSGGEEKEEKEGANASGSGEGLKNRKEARKGAGSSMADVASAPVDAKFLEFLTRFYSAVGTKFRDGNEW